MFRALFPKFRILCSKMTNGIPPWDIGKSQMHPRSSIRPSIRLGFYKGFHQFSRLWTKSACMGSPNATFSFYLRSTCGPFPYTEVPWNRTCENGAVANGFDYFCGSPGARRMRLTFKNRRTFVPRGHAEMTFATSGAPRCAFWNSFRSPGLLPGLIKNKLFPRVSV